MGANLIPGALVAGAQIQYDDVSGKFSVISSFGFGKFVDFTVDLEGIALQLEDQDFTSDMIASVFPVLKEPGDSVMSRVCNTTCGGRPQRGTQLTKSALFVQMGGLSDDEFLPSYAGLRFTFHVIVQTIGSGAVLPLSEEPAA